MKVIEAAKLSKNFRVKQKEKGMKGSMKAIFHPQTEEIKAVDNVSFGVEEGEVLAFIGPNGAGKKQSDGGKIIAYASASFLQTFWTFNHAPRTVLRTDRQCGILIQRRADDAEL